MKRTMRSCLENRTTVSSTARAPSSEGLESAMATAGPCFASNESGRLKENIHRNTSELPKLTMEPLQMKRKRKGGVFNLRKSLAWDRAFFTEEGVLDPQELSVISGASWTERLPCINEHTTGTPQHPTKSIDKQKLKNNASKKLQDGDLAKDTKKDLLDSSSSNFIPSSSLPSHKVSTPVGCKSESRCGDFARSLSSLKRPPNVNVGKAAGKELKLLKGIRLNPGLSPICTTTKTTIPRPSRVKHNQLTQPGLNSSCESLKDTQNAAESLQSALHSYGNSGNSSFRKHSSISTRPLLVDKADNSGSKIISDTVNPARSVHASEAHVCGRTMHLLQNQGMKPSGLRMPSPSLSFFSESKPSGLCGLAWKGAGVGVLRLQGPQSCSLNEKWRRTTGIDNNIPELTISSKAMSSSSVYMASSQVGASSTKPTMEQAPKQKVCLQVLNEQISQNEAELWTINVAALSQSGSQEKVTNEIVFTNSSDVDSVNSESCDSEIKNSEQQSEQKYGIQETKAIIAIDESSEKKRNHGAIIETRSADSLDHRVQKSLTNQSDWEDACKSDKDNCDSVKYSLDDTDTDKNLLQSTEIEKLGVSQFNGQWCSQCSSTKSLEHRPYNFENSYFGSENLQTDLSKESDVTGVLANNLCAGQPLIRNVVCVSNIGECMNDISLTSGIDDGSKQPGNCTFIRNSYPEGGLELQENIELNTGERLPEKQIHLPKCLQEQNIEKSMFVVQDRTDGSKVLDSKTESSLSQCKVCDCNSDEEKIIGQSLSCTISESVDNSMSLERCNNVINSTFSSDVKHGGTNFTLHSTADQNLSSSLHNGFQRTEIDHCSSSPVSRHHEVSEQNSFGEMGLILQCGFPNNKLTLRASLKENESHGHNAGYGGESRAELVWSPKSSKCCLKESDHLTLPNAKFGAQNLEHGNLGLHFETYLLAKNPTYEPYKDNELQSKEEFITEKNKINTSTFESPSIPAQESPLKHGSCNDASGTHGQLNITDTQTDSHRDYPLFDTTKSEVSKNISSFSSPIHPNLDAVEAEAYLAPVNMHGDGHNQKSCSSAFPPNAIPFSDEWFSAIEAAGEDILTKKSGAVQNSPPDKSLPEPSPWSPVKKKNNQIGPYDCTKFNSALPSDSN